MDKLSQAHIGQAKSADVLSLASQMTKLKKKSNSPHFGEEWKGPCPRCGGEDRFAVRTGINRWACRQCTGINKDCWFDAIALIWFIETWQTRPQGKDFIWCVNSILDKKLPTAPTPEPEDSAGRQEALARFTNTELWQELHRRMTQENRDWWTARGVPPVWQDKFTLGFTPDWTVQYHEKPYHTPAYSIPYRSLENKVHNLQFRLTNPPAPGDRYRWIGKLGASFFVGQPEMGLTEEVFIAEGAIKAMVFISEFVQGQQVLATPTNGSWAGMPDAIKGRVKRAWIILDPDSNHRAHGLGNEIGRDVARIITLPAKLDDLILHGMEYRDFDRMRYFARPPRLI